tara:strand:+ start:3174 stop:3800 length:627 start_codon:yes stop_codon:yes gene_type:complete
MSESLQPDMDNETTIESILPASVLDLVRRAPANPMTRGQVRAHTNLVYPDEVNTTEGIKEYVLENYVAPPIEETPSVLSYGADRLQRLQQERRNAVFDAGEVTASEREYGRVDYTQTCHYFTEFHPSREDLQGCHTKGDFIDRIDNLLRDLLTDDGPSDWGNMETGEGEERNGADDWEQSVSADALWEQHKESIAQAMGMELEDIENE